MGDSSKSRSRQRRHPRFQVRDVRGSFPLRFEVEVLNMSLTGLAVECPRPLEIGKEYEFTLQTGDEGVELKANVQWCHLVRTERSIDESRRPLRQAVALLRKTAGAPAVGNAVLADELPQNS